MAGQADDEVAESAQVLFRANIELNAGAAVALISKQALQFHQDGCNNPFAAGFLDVVQALNHGHLRGSLSAFMVVV